MRNWTEEEEELIIELYNKGCSNLSICSHFPKRGYSSVNNKIKKMREKKMIKPRMEYATEYAPHSIMPEVEMPLTAQELRYDLRNYSRLMKKKLESTKKLMNQDVIHIGATFVVVQGKKYRKTYSYYELKQMGIKCN